MSRIAGKQAPMAIFRGGKPLPSLRPIAQIPTIPFEPGASGPIPRSWVQYLQLNSSVEYPTPTREIGFGVYHAQEQFEIE
jgi:hypothetical protein